MLRESKEPRKNEVQQELEILRQLSAEKTREKQERAETAERAKEAEAKDREAAFEVRKSMEAPAEPPAATPYREELYGAFASERRTADGKIVLEGAAAEAADEAAAGFHKSAKLLSNLGAGEKIAADYDTRTSNFRAQTRLAELPDGRKVFMAYDYPGSWVHRGLDGLMKRLNGLPMRKARAGEWKKWHEAKSPIPVIENGDPHLAMMPHVPNANGKDVFAHNKEIEDFGSCDWAKNAGLEEKNALSGKIMDEMRRFHGEKGAWGEAVLSNVIFTEKQEPVMCDFEVAYDEDVPLAEAKARDLKDMCMSIGAALEAAHGQDVATTVKGLLDRYGDAEVIDELKKLATARRSPLQSLAFFYEKARTGTTGKKQYDAVRAAIAAYEAPENA